MKRIAIPSLLAVILAGVSLAQAAPKKKHPAQVVQIHKELKALLSNKKEAFITLTEDSTERTIQVAHFKVKGKRTLSLMIAYYPTREEPAKAFAAAGIKIRKGWKQTEFEAGTFVQYDVPKEDAKYLPYFIHFVFRKFYKSGAGYKLIGGVDLAEPDPVINFDPGQIKVEVSAGDSPQAGEEDVDGATISFPGIRTTTSVNGTITDARVGNMDEDMKEYRIVLDTKGKAFAAAKGIVFRVTGKVKIEGGQRLLVVTDYKKQ